MLVLTIIKYTIVGTKKSIVTQKMIGIRDMRGRQFGNLRKSCKPRIPEEKMAVLEQNLPMMHGGKRNASI